MDETGHDVTNKKLEIYKFGCGGGGGGFIYSYDHRNMHNEYNSKTLIFINLYKYSILMCIV